MKQFSYYFKIMFFTFVGAGIVLLSSCGDDEGDGPLPARPSIEFDGGNTATTAERGDEVNITLNLNAPAGIRSLTVDGTALTVDTEAESDSVDYTYQVAEDAAFGAIELNFQLTDDRDRVISEVFTINVIGSTIEISEDIIEDATWEAANTYIIIGQVDVDKPATLTIEPGTNIYAQYDEEDPVRLKIDGGASLIAEGTAENPIVFSSSRALEGTAEANDWIGLRLEGDLDGDPYTINLSYARIEYAGNSAGNSIAFHLENVGGDNSDIHHIQVFRSGTFGMEARGGDNHMSHLVFTECEGASIELDDDEGGFSGSLQFVIVQSSDFADKEDRDLQMRDELDVRIANMTMIGPGFSETGSGTSMARMRDDVGKYQFYNSIFAEYPNDGWRSDQTEGFNGLEGDQVIAYSYFFRIGDDITRNGDGSLPFESEAETFFNTISKTETPAAAAGIGIASFIPDELIPSDFDPSTWGDNFESAPFVGAIGSTDWTLGWTVDKDGNIRE
ncbi:MAG: hypothetical protein ACOCXH_01885 [Cyclobacteriaceae bacterium]